MVAYWRLGGDETPDQAATTTDGASASSGTQVSATVTPSPTVAATSGDLFLRLADPAELEVVTETDSMTVAGLTRVDAMVTINDSIVEPNIDGEFSLDMTLVESPNVIEVVVSVASGEQKDLVLVAVYAP
ncbi:MAG: hypothetical protein O2913_12325 [Chloroflexi bacterium]|nr:hypothetical protein [Chloroflexota bacterium]